MATPSFNPGGDGVLQNPDAQNLANFIDDAHSANYGSIDPNIITSIGHSLGNTNQGKLALASVKQGLAIPIKTSQYLYEPSAVAPQQTPSKIIQDHVTNTGITPIPIATIKTMQQQLMDAKNNGISGLYTPPNAKADGIWSSDWANAQYQYNLDKNNQPGFGNTGARNLFSTIFNPGFLSYAIPFVSSIIKNVPGDALKALGGGLKLTADAVNAFDNFVSSNGASGKSQAVHIANFLGNQGQKIEGQTPLTDAQYGAQSNWEHALNIANAALTFSTLGKVVEEVGLATKGAVAAGEAAGATSKLGSLVTKIDPMAPKGPLNWIMNTAMPNTADGNARFAFTNWLKNSPTAMKLVPNLTAKVNAGLDATATDMKGLYQTARRDAATPYSRPITAIAGQAASAISTAGLKFGIQGHLDNWMGDPNAPVAYELDHLKPIAGMTGLGLNLLQMVAHGDTGSVPALSERTGNIFAQAQSGLATALNRNGLLPDWERGTGASVNKTLKNLGKQGIHPDEFFTHVMDQADKFAAQHAAQPLVDSDITKGLVDKSSADQVHLAQLNQASVIRNDPEQMAKARASYIQKKGMFAKDVANSMLDSRESSKTVFSSDLASLIKSRRITQSEVFPHIDTLITPHGIKDDTSWMSVDSPKIPDDAKPNLMSSEQVKQAAKDSANPLSKSQLTRIAILTKQKGFADKDAMYKFISEKIGRNITSRNQLTSGEATRIIQALKPPTISTAKTFALNGRPLEGQLGLMRYGLPTAEDAEAKAMDFAQQLEKAKPGYVAPKTIAQLKVSSDGSVFGSEAKPWQMPRTHMPDYATPEETALRANVMSFLGSELGRNIHDLAYVPTQDLIKLIAEKANLLAHDVKLPDNAPQSLIDAFEEVKNLGYKHVWGTDIGHIFSNPLVDLQALGTQQNFLSNKLDKWGINFTPMADETSVSSVGAKNGMDSVIESKNAKDPTWQGSHLWATGSRLTDFVQSMIKPETNFLAHQAINVSASPLGKLLTFKGLNLSDGGAWKNELEALVKRKSWTDPDSGKIYPIEDLSDAKGILKKILATDSSPQSWTRKQFIDALTNKGDETGMVEDKYGHQVQAVGISTKDASDLWYGMKKGLRSAPAYQSGTNVLGRIMNSTLGLDNVPLAINGKRLLDITGPVQNALIQARYLYSPRQAYLRVVKSALKGVNENMPYSMNARASMESELTKAEQDAAKALTEKVYGKNESALDPTAPETKEFASKDFFNIFDPQAVLERTVHYVSKNMLEEGKTLDSPAGISELKARVDAINNYGERTAAEKTLNGFFFPFSFEKTVVRELGSHLLDNPSTRLATAAAIHVYNSTDGKKMDKWLQDNVPLWKEVEKFNPFYHGEGLGQFGGINRTPEGIIGKALYGNSTMPDFSKASDQDKLGLFLKMMEPKPVSSQASLKAIINLSPALKDLNNIFVGYDLNGNKPFSWDKGTMGGELKASIYDLAHQANSAIHTFMGQDNTSPYTSQSYQPYDLQQTNAWNLRNQYITGLLPALQANASGGTVAFLPDTPGVGGLKVTKSNIDKLIAEIYPKWNPNLDRFSKARDAAALVERRNIQSDVKRLGPNLLSMYDNFTTGSNSVQSQIQKSDLDPNYDYSKIMSDMDTLRTWASWLAAADPKFPAFYAKYYASKYGPLKGL